MVDRTAAFAVGTQLSPLHCLVSPAARCRRCGIGSPPARRARARITACSLSATPSGDAGVPDVPAGGGPGALSGGLRDESAQNAVPKPPKTRSKLFRRVSVGFLLGAIVIATIFSGPWVFAVGMALACILGQQEYYEMAKARGHLPATRLGRLTTALMMFVSVLEPGAAEAVFAIGGSYICCYLLFRQRPRQATIADVSTTFMGLFYAGYLPDFWVRLHTFNFATGALTPGSQIVTNFFAWMASILPFAITRPVLHAGAVTLFWSWLANAFADIGAFFTGRAFGRTRLIHISPKKTVEGALGGLACSTAISMAGAYLMGWPLWYVTGACYGMMVGIIGPLGDLTESLFKRDAGIKDSGDLIPGHGGILDRTDSYVFLAPMAYYITTYLLPAIRRMVGGP